MSTLEQKNRAAAEMHDEAVEALDRAVGAAITSAHAYHEHDRMALIAIADALGVRVPVWSENSLHALVEAVRGAVRWSEAGDSERVLAENEQGGKARAVVADIARRLGLDLTKNQVGGHWSAANMGRVTDAVRVLVGEQRDRAQRADEAQDRALKLTFELAHVNVLNTNLNVRVVTLKNNIDYLRGELREARGNVLYEVHDAINRIDEGGE